jgi:hypothetical protein
MAFVEHDSVKRARLEAQQHAGSKPPPICVRSSMMLRIHEQTGSHRRVPKTVRCLVARSAVAMISAQRIGSRYPNIDTSRVAEEGCLGSFWGLHATWVVRPCVVWLGTKNFLGLSLAHELTN